MIRIHSYILFSCSVIGFFGHYLQYGVVRATPWIPALAAFFIYFTEIRFKKSRFLRLLPFVLIVLFGILTTTMTFRFLPQEFQPIRKKIIFSLMTISALYTTIHQIKGMLQKAN